MAYNYNGSVKVIYIGFICAEPWVLYANINAQFPIHYQILTLWIGLNINQLLKKKKSVYKLTFDTAWFVDALGVAQSKLAPVVGPKHIQTTIFWTEKWKRIENPIILDSLACSCS